VNCAHIYLLSGTHPELPSAGGVRPYVVGLARHLHRRGHVVHLIGAGPPASLDYAEFVSVTPSFPISSYDFILSLWRWLRAHPIDPDAVVHGHRPDDLYPVIRSRGGRRTVLTLHGDPSRGVVQRRLLGRFPYYFAEWRTIRSVARVISVSRSGLQAYSSRYPGLTNKSTVIPVAVDLDAFRPTPEASTKSQVGPGSSPVVLYAGRLEPEKRVDVLLDAVRNQGAKWNVLIAGDGRLTSRLHSQAPSANVRFLGPVPHDAMPALYSSADVLVLPSAYEGVPTVILEAMACGTPVIATDVGDIRDVIHEGENGYLFDGTPSHLRALVDTHLDQLRSMRARCVRTATRFGWDVLGDRVLEVYANAS
jgi:glycosyltransferase involved in cell wall biosynthesis